MTNLKLWTEKNLANGRNLHDGLCWSYNSIAAFAILFEYLSEKQLRGAIQKCLDAGLIAKGNYNNSPYDRTCWYALTNEAYDYFPELDKNLLKPASLSTCPKVQMKLPKGTNEIERKGEPIPSTPTSTHTNTTTDSLQDSKCEPLAEQLGSSSGGDVVSEDKKPNPEIQGKVEIIIDRETDEAILAMATSEHHTAKSSTEYLKWCLYWITHECKAGDQPGKIRALFSILKKQSLTKPKGFADVVKDTIGVDTVNKRCRYQSYFVRIAGDKRLRLIPEDYQPLSFDDWIAANEPEKHDCPLILKN